MADKLRFEYGAGQDAEQYPAWSDRLPRWLPCSYAWLPGMWDSRRQEQHGHILTTPPAIPWEWNIQEIIVQSRKAYELLCRVDRPPIRNPMARICPPHRTVAEKPSNTHDVLVVSPVVNDGITALLPGWKSMLTVGSTTVDQLLSARVAVFPFADLADLDVIACAIACGCGVVASDANATEEHLCQFAPPGSWHAMHCIDAGGYREAIKHLLGQPNQYVQTEHKDNSPWMPLTS